MGSRRRNHGRAERAGPLMQTTVCGIVSPDRLRLTQVQIVWPELVDGPLHRSAWPAGVQRDVLTLAVVDNQWLHELLYYQTELLGRIRARVPQAGIRQLRMRVGRIPPPAIVAPPPPDPPRHSLPDEPDAETRGAMMEIEDPSLRQAIANARMALTHRLQRNDRRSR